MAGRRRRSRGEFIFGTRKAEKDQVPPEELQKSEERIFSAGEYRRLTANTPILMELLQYEGEGDWHEINDEGQKIQAVTAADIQRVATTYFTRETASPEFTSGREILPTHQRAVHE